MMLHKIDGKMNVQNCGFSATDKVYFVRYILSGTYCLVCFIRVPFVRYILSGIYCPDIFCPVYFARVYFVLVYFIRS